MYYCIAGNFQDVDRMLSLRGTFHSTYMYIYKLHILQLTINIEHKV